jgi:hypothetical protein
MATFRIDQVTPGAGVAGRARHDLVPGEIITLTATAPTGPGVSYTWEILDKVGSTAVLSATTGTAVTVGPFGSITRPCAFRVRLTADDNGTVTTQTRVFSVRTLLTNLRIPTFGESASASNTFDNNDPDDSEDNALYANRAGLGASEQNWRAYAEWSYELVQALETLAGSASVTLAGDATGPSGMTVVERIQGRDVLDAAPTDGQVLTWVAANNQWEPEDPPAGGYPVVALHEVVAGTNTVADTPDVPLVLGGFVLDPSAFDYSTLTFTFRMLGTMFSGGADGRIDLYDLGPPGAPIVPARRARLSIDPTDSGVPVELTQVLTLDATPGVDANEIRTTASMYEVRLLLDAGSPGDLLHILNAGVRVEGSLV